MKPHTLEKRGKIELMHTIVTAAISWLMVSQIWETDRLRDRVEELEQRTDVDWTGGGELEKEKQLNVPGSRGQ